MVNAMDNKNVTLIKTHLNSMLCSGGLKTTALTFAPKITRMKATTKSTTEHTTTAAVYSMGLLPDT